MTEAVSESKNEEVPLTMENQPKQMLVTLADAGVDFVVGGGVACVLHGVERVTLDLDIAVQMNPPNLERLIRAVEPLRPKDILAKMVETIEPHRKWGTVIGVWLAF